MGPSITIRNLSYSYFQSGREALHSCSFSVKPGTCCAVLGPSGAGKTTLFQVLSGIASSQISTGRASGSISFGEQTFTPAPERTLFPLVGFFMSDPLIQISGIKDTVAEEIGFTLDNLGIVNPGRSGRLEHVLRQVGLAHLADRHPLTLSGGEMQRVALASILVARPSVLLLDEPGNALDNLGQESLVRSIRTLKTGTTILMADNNLDLALRVADSLVVLDSGKVVFEGGPRGFYQSMRRFEHLLPVRFRLELENFPKNSLRPALQRMIAP